MNDVLVYTCTCSTHIHTYIHTYIYMYIGAAEVLGFG